MKLTQENLQALEADCLSAIERSRGDGYAEKLLAVVRAVLEDMQPQRKAKTEEPPAEEPKPASAAVPAKSSTDKPMRDYGHVQRPAK